MIVLPWIAFLAGIIWLIRQGDKEKAEYLRRRKQDSQKTIAAARLAATLRTEERPQPESQPLTKALGLSGEPSQSGQQFPTWPKVGSA